MKCWARVLLLTEVISAVLGIKCYTCDVEQNVTCPGWDRSDLGGKVLVFSMIVKNA